MYVYCLKEMYMCFILSTYILYSSVWLLVVVLYTVWVRLSVP